MALVISIGRSMFIPVVLLFVCGLQSCRSKSLGSSNISELNADGSKFTRCTSTSCPAMKPSAENAASSFVNYFSLNDSLLNDPKRGAPHDVKSAEFALLHNLLEGIIHRFSETNTGTESITEFVNLITFSNGTGENETDRYSSTIPPALFRNMKNLAPPFLSDLLGRLTEIHDGDLLGSVKENESSSESNGLLETLRQTMLDLAHDQPKNDKMNSSNGKNESTYDMKNELDGIMKKLKQQVRNPTSKTNKVDQLCDMLEKNVNARIQSLNETGSSNDNEDNRIVVTLKETTDVVCSDGNKKLLNKLANSRKIWSNRITKRVLARAIDRISKGKTMLRFILNLIIGVIVEPQQSQSF